MTDTCKTCRWPVRLHGATGCPSGVPKDANVDELAAWLEESHTTMIVSAWPGWSVDSENDKDGTAHYAYAPTILDALRAVVREVLR